MHSRRTSNAVTLVDSPKEPIHQTQPTACWQVSFHPLIRLCQWIVFFFFFFKKHPIRKEDFRSLINFNSSLFLFISVSKERKEIQISTKKFLSISISLSLLSLSWFLHSIRLIFGKGNDKVQGNLSRAREPNKLQWSGTVTRWLDWPQSWLARWSKFTAVLSRNFPQNDAIDFTGRYYVQYMDRK